MGSGDEAPKPTQPELGSTQGKPEDQEPSKGTLMEMAATFFQSSGSFTHSEIAEKVTSEHIGQILTHQEKHDARVLDDRKDNRKTLLALAAMAVAGLLGLVAILVYSDNPDLIEDVIQMLGAGLVGWFGGWGYGRRQSS